MSDWSEKVQGKFGDGIRWSSRKPRCLDTRAYRTLLPLQYMLNLNGGENLEMSVVVFGISGLYDLAEITIWFRADVSVFENAKIVTLGVKDRTVGAHGKRYVSVIRQHSSADTLVVS